MQFETLAVGRMGDPGKTDLGRKGGPSWAQKTVVPAEM